MPLAAFALATTLATSDFFLDDDNDGLLNGWERHGFGPLNPEVQNCNPKHADIIICFRIRPGMTEATVKPTIERLTKFYADMPFTNPDGKRGLNLIPVVLPPHPEDKGQGYIEFYNQGMPTEWRGLAHGVFVSNSPGGGGQANRPDWCGTGYDWWTIAHEVGHQLGLPHNVVKTMTIVKNHTREHLLGIAAKSEIAGILYFVCKFNCSKSSCGFHCQNSG
jgi:hypothetical protein